MSKPSVILAVNAGSSSLKLSVYKADPSAAAGTDPTRLADAELSGLTAPPAKFNYASAGETRADGDALDGVSDPHAAFEHVLARLLDDGAVPELSHKDDVAFVVHRIVHGGGYAAPRALDDETERALDALADLAPLHEAAGLALATGARKSLPGARQVVCFDSAFHASMPRHVRTYAVDPAVAEKNGLRKYGFHGISYAFIARAVAGYLQQPVDKTNVIALHLGSGASACAIRDGKSYDTTMGLTPVSGLPGGTRSGDVDPSLIFHYTRDAGEPSRASTKELHITQAEEILNKKSGFAALAGTSDFGKIIAADDEMSRLTVDLFVDRVVGFIGSYYVKLGGRVDALVFAGGIGEKSAEFRRRVVDAVACLGFALDKKKHDDPTPVWNYNIRDIGAAFSKHNVLVCQTDEQLEMARGCIQHAQDASK